MLNGYPDGSFRPDAQITREEFAALLGKLLDVEQEGIIPALFTDYDDIAPWARPGIAGLADHEILKGYGDNTFRPQELLTRAELATVVIKSAGLNAIDSDRFVDQAEIPARAAGFAAAAVQIGSMEPREGNRFAPYEPVARGEVIDAFIRPSMPI